MSSESRDIDSPGGVEPRETRITKIKATNSHAFNLSITDYDDGAGDRKGMQVFAVESLKKVGTSTECLAAIKNANPKTLPSLLPLREELEFDPEDKDITTVVWVGMLPSSADLEGKTKMAGGKSYYVNSADNVKRIETDPDAMRVVCPRGKATAVYYALVSQGPNTKRCTGVMTGLDSVFFFPEFRDDNATSVQKRKDTWGAKVREACGQSEKTKGNTKRTYDTTELFDESQRSISAEVTGLDQSTETTGESQSLQSPKRIEMNMDSEDRQNVLYSNPGLLHFVSAIDGPPTEEMAENALKNIQALWPWEASILTSTILMQIHHCIRTSKVTIIYHHLRMFLVECARSVAQTQQPMGDAEAARIAYAAEQHILLLIDDDEVLFQEPDSRNIIMDTRELDSE